MADPFCEAIKDPNISCKNLFLTKMADPTRLELATSAVTGQRSNQLSYESTLEEYILQAPFFQEHAVVAEGTGFEPARR